MTLSTPALGGLIAACAVWATACGDVVAQPIGAGPGDGSAAEASGADGGDGDAITDGHAPDGSLPGTDASFCAGSGPIPTGVGDQCTGDVAQVFRFAACACDSLAVSGDLVTSSVDGGAGTFASIAANGQVATNAQATIAGSVWAGGQGLTAGTPAVSLNAPSTATSSVALDVQSGGDVQTSGTVLVGGNLFASGDVTIDSGSLSVVGEVEVPSGDTANGVTTGGGVVHGPVSIAPPCDCSSHVDIGAIVAANANSNDDADGGLTTTSLDDPSTTVTLGCGLFYVDGIQGTSPVTIDVTGRAALFVANDVDAEGGLTINLLGGELDLFVAGNVTLKGATIGDPSTPSKTRVYVGGSTLALTDAITLAANVYAPKADVQLASAFTMQGALFAQSLEFSGSFQIAYDGQILQTPGCAPSGGPCQTCNDCAGATPACKGGTCTLCTSDSDCCAPLECVTSGASAGSCVPPAQ